MARLLYLHHGLSSVWWGDWKKIGTFEWRQGVRNGRMVIAVDREHSANP
jgi:hypothetical protein